MTDSEGAPLPPFPAAECLGLPDEELAFIVWTWWVARQVELKGVQIDRLTWDDRLLIVEKIRQATLGIDTDNVASAATEKFLRLLAAGDFARAGPMIRTHFAHVTQHIAALDEAATGRHRQRANARKERTDGLQYLIMRLMEGKPTITQSELLAELRKHAGGDTIDTVDDETKRIEWHDKNPRTQRIRDTTMPFSGLKDRMSRARKKLRSR